MGTCIYCGQKAGFLKSKHPGCESNFNVGKNDIIKIVSNAIIKKSDHIETEKLIKLIATESHIKDDEMTNLYVKGFDNAVESFLEDGLLTIEEEDKISEFQSFHNFKQDVYDINGSLQKVVRASILREIMEGNIPESKLSISGNLPFLLQKNEIIIWLFKRAEYYEQATRTVYEGRSHGTSIRIAKGLYYRTGSFKGHPVKVQEMKRISDGLLALTNKHLYFSSAAKSFKIPYSKIIALDQYEDGIGIHRDGVNTKPQAFQGIDGWFTFNLISNLQHS